MAKKIQKVNYLLILDLQPHFISAYLRTTYVLIPKELTLTQLNKWIVLVKWIS